MQGLYSTVGLWQAGARLAGDRRLVPLTRTSLTYLALSLALSAGSPLLAAEDPRRVFGPDAPDWLRAVGKLEVAGLRYNEGHASHQRENCSATLVGSGRDKSANTAITAWHCLENYRDLSQPITLRLHSARGGTITREARRVADGGGMYADWAVLKLSPAVAREDVVPLDLHPGRAEPSQPIIMAGYSADAGLGAGGEALTYDADCRITRQAARESESDCRAFKGASGGAVIQLDARGEARVCGVISRGDSVAASYFVPLERFRSALRPGL